MDLTVLRVIIFVVLARLCSFAEAPKIVKRVVIYSSMYNLGRSYDTAVIIQRKGGKYLSSGRPVSAVQVQSLVDALSAAPLTGPDMTNLGITDEWLASKVESQKVESQRPNPWAIETTASQEKLFQQSFTDLNLVAHVLPNVFGSFVFDLIPYCKVEIVFNHGSKLSAESYSYDVFMLPWSIKGRGITYNADISRAVASLLPAESTNKGTLAGAELASHLAYAVMASIKQEWDLLGAEERAGKALKTLRTAYEVITAELTETDLHATVRRSNFPTNVTDALVLRYADKTVEGVDAFLKSAAKYEDLALSVPWLNDYIRDNPGAAVRILYVHDKSFGDKAMGVFAADMKRLGREDLIVQVKSQQAGIALLRVEDTYTESHWLLFPDKHMVLWRYAGSSKLLKWTPKDFRKGKRECSDSFIMCAGREITAEGTLAPGTHY